MTSPTSAVSAFSSVAGKEVDFQVKFPSKAFKVRHSFCERPEFALENLVELAQRLPAYEVEYFSGKVPVNQDPGSHPRNGLSVADTVRRIEDNGSWMVLKNVQSDPAYRDIMRQFLDEVYARVGPSISGMHREEAFIFISSPGSVTPYHLDEEHNFLLQVRGSKEISMWDPKDRVVMPEAKSEFMLQVFHSDGYHRNMTFEEEHQARATVYELQPGDGLHFPVGAPHWVKNGNGVSVSFSVTFRSEQSERQAVVYYVNRRLRRLGITPTPPAQSAWRDNIKCGAFNLARRAARVAPWRRHDARETS